jgi:hypothetical protein
MHFTYVYRFVRDSSWTPLMSSAFHGCLQTCKVLVDSRADVGCKEQKTSKTALTLALEQQEAAKAGRMKMWMNNHYKQIDDVVLYLRQIGAPQ